jgi:large subunit ribosomal protein L30
VSETKPTLHIQWVRSGIGFPLRQKEVVRSLGLRRLNHVVERPDTPQIRGLVAKIPHLVKVVERAAASGSLALPEYVIVPPERQPVSKPAADAPANVASVESAAAAALAAETAVAAGENPEPLAEKPERKRAQKGKAKEIATSKPKAPKAASKPKVKASASKQEKAAKSKK